MPKPLTSDDLQDAAYALQTAAAAHPNAAHVQTAVRTGEILLAEVKRLRDVEPKIDQLHAQLRERRNDYVKSLGEFVQAAAALDQERQADIAELTKLVEWAKAQLEDIDSVIGFLWPSDADSRARHIRNVKAQLDRDGKWRQLVSDLDRCPHWRHEGDTCGGWRGPGLYDGGCKGGVSLGNPLLGPMAVLGVTVHGKFIRVPENRADKHNPDAWLTDAEPGEELHHHLPGYVPEGLS